MKQHQQAKKKPRRCWQCWSWYKYDVEDLHALMPQVQAFLERYHYHRPHLAFEPMRPPNEGLKLAKG